MIKRALFVGLSLFSYLACASTNRYFASDHFDGENFVNPTSPPNSEPSFLRIFSMLLEKRAKWPKHLENKGTPKLNEKLGPADIAITFVNHATLLIQMPGLNILTDPVWSTRTSPFSWIGPSRVRDPGVHFEELPHIDLVLISHNHYDHLDLETLKRLNHKFAPKVLVASGDKELLVSVGIKDVHELDWWEEIQISPTLKISFVPTQHFSSRGLFDHNKSLWGSYMIQNNGRLIYFGGDAGYSSHYTEIKRRLGAPDISLLAIGAYEPNWFMKSMHMSPSEAVKAHSDLGSKRSIGIAFGTYQLSAEAVDQPPRDLKEALVKAGISEDRFITLDEGETRIYKGEK
jgi:L-ascorbate metabolism protein UlaG (beta-lactamase superfamily)